MSLLRELVMILKCCGFTCCQRHIAHWVRRVCAVVMMLMKMHHVVFAISPRCCLCENVHTPTRITLSFTL